MAGSGGAPLVALFVGAVPPDGPSPTSPELKLASAASPVTYVTRDDPPVLLIHGDADRIVPYQQSEVMLAALTAAGVPVKLLRIAGADHGPDFPGAKNPPDYKAEIVRWFDAYLRRSGS
jgi:dipeptidyl aminopeptidase/acylaminoacyl peptidase